ncbi:hypothetical protein [Actinoallomurus sp. CA-150999]|uniref:hypothetical protein n=1 Tax=Actinoallomurus sp. CA-150999 TaxID=3239887 RepID=UPI003D919DF8
MTQYRHIARALRREVPARRKVLRALFLCMLLAAVLTAGRTERGASVVLWLRAFLEFFSGVFSLVTLTAAIVAGLVASGRFVPIGLRILAQSAHRAAAVMAMSFLTAHVLLKVLERHASVLAVVVPFLGDHGRVLWIGLGTIASNMMIIIFATGVARGRFIGATRGWIWRALHVTAYLCWPIAIVHGLKAGRAAKDWVTLSYAICFALVVLVAFARLVSAVRQRRTARRQGGPGVSRPAEEPTDADMPDVPDERFWSELKAEAAQWTESRR